MYLGNKHTDIAILSVIDLGSDNSTGTGIFITDYPDNKAFPAFLITSIIISFDACIDY